MSIRHLKELETDLNNAHWQIVERVDREDYRDPCFWIVARPDGTAPFRIAFLEDPDKDTQTVLDSFAAEAELESIPGLYFARGSSWRPELKAFVSEINAATKP